MPADWGNLLFEQALLAEGGQLDDLASFMRWVNGLLAMRRVGRDKDPFLLSWLKHDGP